MGASRQASHARQGTAHIAQPTMPRPISRGTHPNKKKKKASAVPKSNNGKKWATTDSLSQMTPIRWAEIGLGRRVMPHLCCAVLCCQLLLTHSHSLDNTRFLFQYLMLCSSFLSPCPRCILCPVLPCPTLLDPVGHYRSSWSHPSSHPPSPAVTNPATAPLPTMTS